MRFKMYFAGFVVASMLAPVALSATAISEGLIPNASMEVDADANQWPDDWPKLKAGGSWEQEAGNHFIRITSTTPGEMVMLYREITIPEGVTELTLTWKQRISNLTLGEQKWFDARIMMEWMDAARNKVSGKPTIPSRNKNTEGWEDKSISIFVPDGARILKFMPTLFRVEAGTFDIDDVQLTPKGP